MTRKGKFFGGMRRGGSEILLGTWSKTKRASKLQHGIIAVSELNSLVCWKKGIKLSIKAVLCPRSLDGKKGLVTGDDDPDERLV